MDYSTKLLGIFVGACGLGFSSSAAEQLPADLDQYDWRSTLSGSFESGQTYKVPLPVDVYEGFRTFPLDFRVVDKDGETWPSVVWAQPDRSRMDVVRAFPRAGGAERNADDPFIAKEFQLEPDPQGNTPIHNRVIVNAGGGEFIRRVEVWGGTDINDLEKLGAGLIIEKKSPEAHRNRAIDYPDSEVPLVVVRVYQDPKSPEQQLDWRTTEIVRTISGDADFEKIELEMLDAPDDQPDSDGVYTIYVDTGAKNRPLIFLDLETSAKNFISSVKVFGRSQETNKWRWVVDGGIYAMHGSKQLRIMLPKADYRQLRLVFSGFGEQRPGIDRVHAGVQPHYLVVEARSAQKAFLYFGSPRYQLPMSDFSRRMNAESIEDAHDADLSSRQTNPTRVASSLSDYGRTLFRFGLGIVILLVSIVTIRVIKHRYW